MSQIDETPVLESSRGSRASSASQKSGSTTRSISNSSNSSNSVVMLSPRKLGLAVEKPRSGDLSETVATNGHRSNSQAHQDRSRSSSQLDLTPSKPPLSRSNSSSKLETGVSSIASPIPPSPARSPNRNVDKPSSSTNLTVSAPSRASKSETTPPSSSTSLSPNLAPRNSPALQVRTVVPPLQLPAGLHAQPIASNSHQQLTPLGNQATSSSARKSVQRSNSFDRNETQSLANGSSKPTATPASAPNGSSKPAATPAPAAKPSPSPATNGTNNGTNGHPTQQSSRASLKRAASLSKIQLEITNTRPNSNPTLASTTTSSSSSSNSTASPPANSSSTVKESAPTKPAPMKRSSSTSRLANDNNADEPRTPRKSSLQGAKEPRTPRTRRQISFADQHGKFLTQVHEIDDRKAQGHSNPTSIATSAAVTPPNSCCVIL